jgi:hypothetical protein
VGGVLRFRWAAEQIRIGADAVAPSARNLSSEDGFNRYR